MTIRSNYWVFNLFNNPQNLSSIVIESPQITKESFLFRIFTKLSRHSTSHHIIQTSILPMISLVQQLNSILDRLVAKEPHFWSQNLIFLQTGKKNSSTLKLKKQTKSKTANVLHKKKKGRSQCVLLNCGSTSKIQESKFL